MIGIHYNILTPDKISEGTLTTREETNILCDLLLAQNVVIPWTTFAGTSDVLQYPYYRQARKLLRPFHSVGEVLCVEL